MQAHYSKADVQPVSAQPDGAGSLVITYSVKPETEYYSKGVNYSADGTALKVVIDRCRINTRCTPMAESELPLDSSWKARVKLPWQPDQTVVLVSRDGEQQIYP